MLGLSRLRRTILELAKEILKEMRASIFEGGKMPADLMSEPLEGSLEQDDKDPPRLSRKVLQDKIGKLPRQLGLPARAGLAVSNATENTNRAPRPDQRSRIPRSFAPRTRNGASGVAANGRTMQGKR